MNTADSTPTPAAPTYHVTVTKVDDNGNHLKVLGKDHTIYTGYTIRGLVAALPTAGERWVVARYERNGEPILGLFETSVVQSVWHDTTARRVVFETQNSRYNVEYTLDGASPSVVG